MTIARFDVVQKPVTTPQDIESFFTAVAGVEARRTPMLRAGMVIRIDALGWVYTGEKEIEAISEGTALSPVFNVTFGKDAMALTQPNPAKNNLWMSTLLREIDNGTKCCNYNGQPITTATLRTIQIGTTIHVGKVTEESDKEFEARKERFDNVTSKQKVANFFTDPTAASADAIA